MKVCLITKKPNTKLLEFFNNFADTEYTPYVIIDDNTSDYREIRESFPKLQFIQYTADECTSRGFVNTNFLISRISGWDKALLHMSDSKEHVWFFEDDVFFYSVETIRKIDKEYPTEDLLCNREENTQHTVSDGTRKDWQWRHIRIYLPPPFYKTMVCSVRMSAALLSAIHAYASTYRELFFLEALFTTVAAHHHLTVSNPSAFKYITYQTPVNLSDLNAYSLYHPVKNVDMHEVYRRHITSISTVERKPSYMCFHYNELYIGPFGENGIEFKVDLVINGRMKWKTYRKISDPTIYPLLRTAIGAQPEEQQIIFTRFFLEEMRQQEQVLL